MLFSDSTYTLTPTLLFAYYCEQCTMPSTPFVVVIIALKSLPTGGTLENVTMGISSELDGSMMIP
ncbi:hypothetical protein GN244_ATG04564 [Phytophthora infestans]|uniref:Uncharacterized protein n=1 Tax=Phytophthora infestans TaxID=4787 RepID=A0A833T654_PHYIN|nr:hypothetical protein GN244_ATG04564 [Phytophthora infestans]